MARPMSTSQGIDDTITAAATLADILAAGARARAGGGVGSRRAPARPAGGAATALTAGARFLREVAHAVDELAAGITASTAAEDDGFEQVAALVTRVLRGRAAERPVLRVVDDS
jgi:hypothetical protein